MVRGRMARKTKYFFNPKSLEFEKVWDNRKYIIWRGVGFASLILVLSIILASFFTRFFASPRERMMIAEQSRLKNQFRIVERQLDELESEMKTLRNRDAQLYRAIYEADPPKPVDYRGDDYEELLNLKESKLVIRLRQKLDYIKKLSIKQSESYELLKNLVEQKQALLDAIPAIQPILNKDLTRLASGFGNRIDPITHGISFHPGMDFTADIGTEVFSTGEGVVEKSMNDPYGYGSHIIINHGYNYKTLYAHLSSIDVRPGQKVKRGQKIGRVGNTGYSTGPHLHYEVRKNDEPVNPAFYYYKELTDADYKRMLELSQRETKTFDKWLSPGQEKSTSK